MPAKMKIRSAYATLPSAERKVADFILANPERAMHMVINEIADAAGVSVPSVTRLARKLGYKGFLEFRVALASGAAITAEAHKVSPIEDTDSDEAVVEKLYLASIRALEDTYRALDKHKVCELAHAIAQAERVFICGGGGSALLAEDITFQLNVLGVQAIAITSQAVLNMYKPRFGKKDVFVGLSRAGRNKQLTEAVRQAKRQGSTCAFMSNYVNAQGAQSSDYFFCTSRVDDMKKILGKESNNAMIALTNLLVLLVARNLNRRIEDEPEMNP